MHKKILAAALLLAMLLSLAACGGGTTDGGETNTPSGTTSQPTQGAGGETSQPTQGPGAATAQPTESAGTETPQPTQGAGTETPKPTEEPAETWYIFSARPVAAFEVTGFDLNSVYEGNYIDKAGDDFGPIPFVKLTPGENSFILFCIYSDDESMRHSGATIHSPAGSSRWEGRTYSCLDEFIDNLPEGYTLLKRNPWDGPYVFNEANDSGEYYSTLDVWLDWIQFSELYHPDAAQDDSIYVIDVIPYSFDEAFDTAEECLAKLVKTFADLGAAATQIDVDEALARCHIEVS